MEREKLHHGETSPEIWSVSIEAEARNLITGGGNLEPPPSQELLDEIDRQVMANSV